MKVRINKYGNLEILRKSKYKTVYCPYTVKSKDCIMEERLPCGDWCALFGEPEYIDNIVDDNISKIYHDVQINIILCKTTYKIKKEDFEDLRGE